MDVDVNNLDHDEVARFAAQADKWWDLKGEYKALHEINPVRLAFVKAHAGLDGRKVLDVGCGGGLLAERMAAAGARVTGIDMAAPSLAVAKAHAESRGLSIDYRLSTAEQWAEQHPGGYDVVTCMELVEHVPAPAVLTDACARLVRPGGDVFFATVNRTLLSRLLVIWLSEFILGIVPKHTHTYEKFVRPDELVRWAGDAGMALGHLSGVRYLPYIGYAALCKSRAMNYLVHFTRKAARRF
jgi:2-polyprenyl-6-hydroxyphenyl methylase / 3-demethylubiquinone-9 3-methyltransferase